MLSIKLILNTLMIDYMSTYVFQYLLHLRVKRHKKIQDPTA